MGRDGKATLRDTWDTLSPSDDRHADDQPVDAYGETASAHDRFLFATAAAKVRRRIPLSPAPDDQFETDLPTPAPRVAEGSSVDLFGSLLAGAAIPVEVRLRPDPAPSAAQIDEVLAWLRTRPARPARVPPPVPAAPPLPALEPLVPSEPPRRGAVWPLCAVSLGLAAAMIAAIIL